MVSLVRAVFAVLLVVTHPNVRDALAITQTFKMALSTSDLSCGKQRTWSVLAFGGKLPVSPSRFYIETKRPKARNTGQSTSMTGNLLLSNPQL